MTTASTRTGAAVLLLAAAIVLVMPPSPAPRSMSWEDIIAPLAVGHEVTRGYVLAPPRREGGDLVYVARRDAEQGLVSRIEIRILDRGRWANVPQTRSFSIGWEAPPAGALVAASTDDADAVRDAVVHAIEQNDRGFASVDSIPLGNESAAPAIVRVLGRLTEPRGMLAGAALMLALMLLAENPFGILVVATALFALGMTLRAASLDVPFAHDQDVQRLFTGGLSLRDIATGEGLQDRHPPLYFFVLHFVERFGQSEAVARAPAVLAGALAAPSVLLAARSMCGSLGPASVLAALALTISPALIDHSRQVSEIPLYGLMLVAAAASLVAALRAPRPARLITLTVAHALALYTYYLAPFIVVVHAAALARIQRPPRRVVLAFAIGIAAGLPAVALGGVTLLRDWSARDVARAFPALAWGQHAPLAMVGQMTRIAVDAFGLPMLALILVAIAYGIVRRDLGAMIPALGAAATVVGIALLAPIARVQDYYVVTAFPLVMLPLAIVTAPVTRMGRNVWIIAAALIVAFSSAPLLANARALYVPGGDAFMPSFARVIVQRPETTVITVAAYDKTILAYYLARVEGRTIGWHTIDDPRTKHIEPLVQVHSLDAGSERAALQRLDAILAAGPALVIERDAFLLPLMVQRLDTCAPVLQAPTGRLVRCAATGDR